MLLKTLCALGATHSCLGGRNQNQWPGRHSSLGPLVLFLLRNPSPCPQYHILLCTTHTHIFVHIMHGITIPIITPMYVIIIPMHNTYPYLPLKNLGKKRARYTQ